MTYECIGNAPEKEPIKAKKRPEKTYKKDVKTFEDNSD